MALPAAAQSIKDSIHDFSATSKGTKWTNTSVDQICVFCHTPHHAVESNGIWNRNNPQGAWTMFSSQFYTLTVAASPNRTSTRCLTCHDGSIAIDALVRQPTGFVSSTDQGSTIVALGDVYYPGNFQNAQTNWGANIGNSYAGQHRNDLSDDHPVSFTYNAALVAQTAGRGKGGADGLVTPAGNGFVDAGKKLPLFTGPNAGVKDQMECSTCHEVHNKTGLKYLLNDTINGSQLCFDCHTK